MPLSNRPWLPTSRGQSAAVYSLMVLLLLNLTVLAVLVSDTIGVSGSFAAQPAAPQAVQSDAERPADRAAAETIDAPRLAAQMADTSNPSIPVATTTVAPGPLTTEVAQPIHVAAVPVGQGATESDTPVDPGPAVREDDPPAQFFGLDVD